MRVIWIVIGFLICINIFAEDFRIDGIRFFCRVPAKYNGHSRILVLFGGRNWPGNKTLQSYRFDSPADKHQVFLLSPSFHDRNYWEPEKWSGKTLLKAIAAVERKYGLTPQKVYFYGYSAGGQCAALFYHWMPERVGAWAAHACGVYPDQPVKNAAPALITCGVNDAERYQISRHFVYRYREAGGELLWKPLPDTGHELSKDALDLAHAWFDAVFAGAKPVAYGEDDLRKIKPKKRIDVEYRNPLYSEKIRELWLK
ncbi:MAG: hypothetical protein E7055_02010 [Lentisphaerae bacterium]|nr:hypothetical protein [Lentisphaerota bacterium]